MSKKEIRKRSRQKKDQVRIKLNIFSPGYSVKEKHISKMYHKTGILPRKCSPKLHHGLQCVLENSFQNEE